MIKISYELTNGYKAEMELKSLDKQYNELLDGNITSFEFEMLLSQAIYYDLAKSHGINDIELAKVDYEYSEETHKTSVLVNTSYMLDGEPYKKLVIVDGSILSDHHNNRCSMEDVFSVVNEVLEQDLKEYGFDTSMLSLITFEELYSLSHVKVEYSVFNDNGILQQTHCIEEVTVPSSNINETSVLGVLIPRVKKLWSEANVLITNMKVL